MITFWLHMIMAVHTAVVILSFASGPAIAWNATRGKPTGALFWGAVGFPPTICVFRLLNGRECILQTWAKTLRGIDSGWARDIYLLNEELALNVVMIGAVFYVSGLCIWALTVLTRR